MGVEIERKYLVGVDWKSKLTTERIVGQRDICQGYLSHDPARTVRVRTDSAAGKAWITVKGQRVGISCSEYEYEIPYTDGVEMLSMCDRKIEKTRYLVQVYAMTWEVDEFRGLNEGLVLAEIELSDDYGKTATPMWVGEEVSEDFRYTNAHLSAHKAPVLF